jgi:microcystin synthetase protein McyG
MADRQGISQKLAIQLRSRGDVCNLVFAGEKYQEIATQGFTINPNNPTDYDQLLAKVSTDIKSNSIEILNFWSLDSSKVEQLTVETLESASRLGCGTVLQLVQALLKTEFNQQPRLWLVTQGAQPVQEINSSMTGLAQSPVWGMGRVISLEHPELWGGMIDLDPNSPTDESVTNLIAEIYESDSEDHVAFRDGQRYVARLMASSNLEPSQSFKFQSDSTYLITGGLGFLGLKLAQWMVERGARNLVLIGRKGFPQRKAWVNLADNSEDKRKTEIVQYLERQGAKLSIFSADVTDQVQMSAVIEQINTEATPLKGIIHAAGISRGCVLEELESQALESVLRPKILGTWILHQLTMNINLDCFICFSSAGSVWGAKGQADYDAANHFLDTFAYYRRSIGLPALSINWGSLGVGGLVVDERYVQWMQQLGLEAIHPEQGFNALGWLLDTNAVQTVVAQVEWNKFKEIYQSKRKRLLLADIENEVEKEELEQSKLSQQKSDILQQLKSGAETIRYKKLTSYIQSEVARVLGIKDLELLTPERGLFDIGLDSLMSVELRNRLQVDLNCSLPTTLAFECPNIASLTEYIGSKILGWELPRIDQSELSIFDQENQEKVKILSEVEELSEEDIKASIAQELTELNRLMEEN